MAFNSGETAADTLSFLHMIKRFFCLYFRILQQNPHYISSRDGSVLKTEQLNSAAEVGEVIHALNLGQR